MNKSRSSAALACAGLLAAAMPAYSGNPGNTGINCVFRTSGTVGLAFGTLDPSVGGVRTATASVEVGDCNGQQTMTVTVDQGLRSNRTMQRLSGTETIQYSVGPATIQGGPSGPGNNAYKTATFTGTVLPGAYLDAVAGTYYDRLIVTLMN